MNKRELIKKYECMNRNLEMWVPTSEILECLRRLDEPEKVKIPKFIADCIEYARNNHWDLEDVFKEIKSFSDDSEIYKWFYGKGNINVLARAWLDGYEIEPGKRYTVKVKANGEYLNWSVTGTFYFSKKDKTYFVKRKLEKSGFGWVFDCEGIEIEEVEG